MRRWRPLALLAALLALATTAVAQQRDSTPLELKFLDVGQADAILVQLGRNAVLVDASRGDDIVQYLEEEGVDSLVAAIASHNHDDHLGGMDAVLDSWPVGMYLTNGRVPGTENGSRALALARERGVPTPPAPWPVIQLGDASISVFPSSLPADEPDENNYSLGVLVERGRFKALMTGDSQENELAGWLRTRKIPDVDLLKAAHHGADNGVIPGWLHATQPEIVVISVGKGNPYGHPGPWALRFYATHNRRILRTDQDGTVVVTVDPSGAYRIATRGPIPR